jgi:hypothetical protein
MMEIKKVIVNLNQESNKSTWCHNECYEMALYICADPIFGGVCHEYCQDEECTLEHSDFDIDHMP